MQYGPQLKSPLSIPTRASRNSVRYCIRYFGYIGLRFVGLANICWLLCFLTEGTKIAIVDIMQAQVDASRHATNSQSSALLLIIVRLVEQKVRCQLLVLVTGKVGLNDLITGKSKST